MKKICPYAGTNAERCRGCFHSEEHSEVDACMKACDNAMLMEGTPTTCVDSKVLDSLEDR